MTRLLMRADSGTRERYPVLGLTRLADLTVCESNAKSFFWG